MYASSSFDDGKETLSFSCCAADVSDASDTASSSSASSSLSVSPSSEPSLNLACAERSDLMRFGVSLRLQLSRLSLAKY